MIYSQQDTVETARPEILNVNMAFLLLGAYGWEYFLTFGTEYAIICRRLPFRWPLVPYLTGRIALLVSLLLLAIGMTQASFVCQPRINLVAVFGAISTGCSSTNLMIRTWVIWTNSRLVHILVFLAMLGHWTLLMLGMMNLKPYILNGACVSYPMDLKFAAVVFLYTMCYDFLVLVLSIVGLSRQPSKSLLKERLRTQGLLYFAVVTVTCIPPTVLTLCFYREIVGICAVLAMTASVIGSGRAVRSLLVLGMSHSSDMVHVGGECNMVLTTQVADQTSLTLTGIY